MMRHLPSLNGLRAFEAAARHESFTRAAAELHVTQGAVSHQVKALEAQLGVALFSRQHQGVQLTGAGRFLLGVTREAFDRLAAGTEELRRREQTGVLTVTLSPNFAAKWLVHRLGRFVTEHPDIDLRIQAALHHVDFAQEDVDLAIRHGSGDWPGLYAERLMNEVLFPVCSPQLLDGPLPMQAPSDLARHTLLHLDSRQDWSKWLEAAGVAEIDLSRGGVVFNQASMAIDAAAEGQGVALARTALAMQDLLAGRLVRPFGPELPAPYSYWIVCPAAMAHRPKLVAFRHWLRAEAQADLDRLSVHRTAAQAP
jgi:LysR family glycine cleavage system transcriptional activator